MEFITRRPTLPLGFRVGDLPPVRKALHSDESIEVYLLETSADSDLILVRSTEPDRDGLTEWWRILDEHLVTDLSEDLGNNTRSIRVHGRWLPGNISSMQNVQWGPLLAASVKLLENAVEANLRPILCSSLLWISKEGLVPVCAAFAESASRAQVLHDLATVLLSCSTGIDPEAVAANIDKVASWNRCMSADRIPGGYG
jgi:hypothetical protein